MSGVEILAQQKASAARERRRGRARVAVAGATGYAGSELVRLLAKHPGVELVSLMSSGRSGSAAAPAEASHPALRGITQIPVVPLDREALTSAEADLVFLATPHEAAHELAPELLDRGLKVIDLSAAFRLRDRRDYPAWYGFEHRAGGALAEAVYGLPELNGPAIRAARLVANPGCYPTSVILALAPLLNAAVVDLSAGIVVDAKSGATGAGRSLRDDLLFASINENCRAYGIFSHRHVPEMLQELNLKPENFLFTPHLLPLSRGLLSTIYVRVIAGAGEADLANRYRDAYAHAPLVRIYEDGKLPEIAAVARTAFADIGFALDTTTRRCVIVSALDNLGKGAAAQAIQNMNLMLDYPEAQGLE